MANTIKVSVLGDVRDINNKLGTVNNQLSGFGKTVGKVGTLAKGLFVGFVATEAVSAVKSAVTAATDLNETISKTETLFGSSSKAVIKWGKDAATSMGMSQNEALTGASTFQNFFNQIGIGTKQGAEFSKSFVQMSADLASFNNAAPTEVMDALASATRGEYDALQKYIPTINAARVEQEAMAASGKDSADALTDQDKAIALHTLAVKGMGKAQGDFARTSGGLANQQRILSAQFANLKTTIGTALIPVITKVVTFLNANMGPAFKAIGKALAPVVGGIKDFFNSSGEGQSKLAPVVDFIKNEVIPAFIGIGQALVDAYNVIRPIITQVVTAITAEWATIEPQVREIWTSVKEIVIGLLEIIRLRIQLATRVIQAIWAKFGATITQYLATSFKNLVTIVGGALKVISGVIKVVSSIMKGDWKGAWDGIKKILSGAMQVIRGVVSQGMNVLRSMMSAAWTAIKALTEAAWNAFKGIISRQVQAALGIVRGIPGAIRGAMSGLGGLLLDAGRAIIQGLIDGITEKADQVKGLLNSITDKIPDWKGPKDKDKKLLTPTGKWIMQGLVRGLEDGRDGVKDVLGDYTDFIEKFYDKRFKNDKKAAKFSKAAIKALGNETKALIKNAKKREAVYRKLEKAQKRLADQVKASKDYAASVKGGVLDYTNVTGLDSAFNSNAMLAELQKRLDKTKQFAALIKNLIKQGLNKTMIDQLVQAGVEGGLGYATAIAQGGPAAIEEFNAVQNEINQAASGLGNTAANNMFGAGIAMTEGLIKGLNKQRKKLEKWFKDLAKDLVKAFKQQLQIKSPSRVFKAIGQYTLEGLQIGLEDVRGVKSAMTNVGDAMTSAYQPNLAVATGSAGSPSGNTYNIHLHTLKADAETGRVIVDSIKQYERIGGRK